MQSSNDADGHEGHGRRGPPGTQPEPQRPRTLTTAYLATADRGSRQRPKR
nr:MAG TPA: hypothetical protein [Caudoviricetes sp.]